MTHEEIMRCIVAQTQKATEEGTGGLFGAAVVKDGEIIALGVNRVVQESDPTAHGEIAAIRNAAKILGPRFPAGHVLYTTSQSCPMCVSAAIWAGIEKIFFSATCEDDHQVGLSDKHVYDYLRGNEDPKLLEQIQLLPELAKEQILKEWKTHI
ncbi:MAG TPA: nucleoside deaminase [Clostridia bacterium]|nr:nucleoside deaminase [Clostridia bacterium]